MLTNHPLKVYYSNGGKHFALNLHTHSKQSFFIVARSMNGLYKAFSNHLKEKNLDLTLKVLNLFEMEIVAPSNKFCALASQQELNDKYNLFINTVLFQFSYHKLPIPKEFTPCPHPREDDYCAECNYTGGKYYSINISKSEFYNKYYPAYRECFEKPAKIITSSAKSKHPKPQYSRARTADDTEKLFAVGEEGGCFSGLNLAEVTEDYFGYIKYFYCTNVKNIDVTPFQKEAEAVIKTFEDNRRKEIEEQDKRRAREKSEEIQNLISVFK